jgi:hypothetical protein
MRSDTDYGTVSEQIDRETDAEVAFGSYLERCGADCDDFMRQWKLSHAQFNKISHFVYGLTDDLPALPLALTALLRATRDHARAA